MAGPRRSPRLWPPAPPLAPLFEDEDLLEEILVRLPALPSSVPGASLVCARWRSIVSDHRFRRRFLERNPALLERSWHYKDPQGVVQGPFELHQLRRWMKVGYFAPDFRVWRTDQTMDKAILLAQAAKMIDYLLLQNGIEIVNLDSSDSE